MKFIQLNLNHCVAAQDLLYQTILEQEIDVALICEQYKNLDNSVWERDSTDKAAVWACGNKAIEKGMRHPQKGFARVKIGGIFVYSCYVSPNITIDEFQEVIDNLVNDAIYHTPTVIGGDFNAWAVDWGSQRTNERGRILLDAFAILDMILANRGEAHTFRRAGYGSVVDLTFVSTKIANDMTWELSEHYTHSDHQAIVFTIETEVAGRLPPIKPEFRGWASEKIDRESFAEVFSGCNIEDRGASLMAEQTTLALKVACDASMPRKRTGQKRKENYWWNENIAKLRKECLKCRRKYQRSRERPDFIVNRVAYQQARKCLQRAIGRSKTECFRQLCNEADSNPWGSAYRVVIAKLKGKKVPK